MEPEEIQRSSYRVLRRTEMQEQSRSNVRLFGAGSESRSGNAAGSSSGSYATGVPALCYSRSEAPMSFSADTHQQPLGSSATDEYGKEVACLSNLSLDESPDINDPRVGKHKDTLRAELQLEHIIASFKKTGSYLRIAVNASADRVEPLIKIQKYALFEVLKVCDSTAILLQSFKNGANNILEKLRIAYLYILDGFPDFAKADIEAVTKDIKTMKDKGKSTSNAVASAKYKIREAETSAKGDWSTRDSKTKQKKHQPAARPETDVALRHKLILRMLELANDTLDSALGSVSKTEQVVEQWYLECKQIIKPTMDKNFQAADKLPKDKQKDFWNPLQFKQEAIDYLCRWRALQDYCEDIRGRIKQTRGIVEAYYTENLYPQDAIKFAWELTKKLQSADKTITGLSKEYAEKNGDGHDETRAATHLDTPQEPTHVYTLSPADGLHPHGSTTGQSDDEEETESKRMQAPSKAKTLSTGRDFPTVRGQGKGATPKAEVQSRAAPFPQRRANPSHSADQSSQKKKKNVLKSRSRKETTAEITAKRGLRRDISNSKLCAIS